ncbi:MAG: hypothetical protein JW993_04680 [Sedimentisphaerales bacterium]|nr:hypothetical protein [Sedimentisphaerales bacterium]
MKRRAGWLYLEDRYMDNLGNNHPTNGNDHEKPIPFEDGLANQPPLSSAPTAGSPGVSRAPLNLGGGGGGTTAARPTPAIKTSSPITKKASEQVASAERITGVKTFFTKLHPGAMEFLDEQVNTWLKENPHVHVKQTNITTGEVQAKKTEPNIIICLWY